MRLIPPWSLIRYLSCCYVGGFGFAGIADIAWQYARHGDYIIKGHADEALNGSDLAFILSLCVAAVIAFWDTTRFLSDQRVTISKKVAVGGASYTISATAPTRKEAQEAVEIMAKEMGK